MINIASITNNFLNEFILKSKILWETSKNEFIIIIFVAIIKVTLSLVTNEQDRLEIHWGLYVPQFIVYFTIINRESKKLILQCLLWFVIILILQDCLADIIKYAF